PPQRAPRPPVERAAIPAAHLSRSQLVTGPASSPEELCRLAWRVAAQVVDPEIPVLTIADLGVLRGIEGKDGRVDGTITPTSCGCPAINLIALDIEVALRNAGIAEASIRTVLSPAWTTDWLTADGRRKLHEYGIAPPEPGARRGLLFGQEAVACPRCGS